MPVTIIFWAAFCFAFPPAFARWVLRAPAGSARFFGEWACCGLCATAGAALGAHGDDWLLVVSWAASGLLGLILWWWSRRKRKRSLKLLGSKAKARLAAMLRNMPRTSPRLVPQRVPV